MLANLQALYPRAHWAPTAVLPEGFEIYAHIPAPTDIVSVSAGPVYVTRCTVAGAFMYFAHDRFVCASGPDVEDCMRRLVKKSPLVRVALVSR